jgi:hypothetical protein
VRKAWVTFLILLLGRAAFSQIAFEMIYGGTGNDEGRCVRQTSDGGYIIAGSTSSFGSGLMDVYLLKVDSVGTRQWEKTFGSSNIDKAYSLDITSDSGFIICGYTNSFGSGGYDVYLIRTDKDGNSLWSKTYGGADWDFGNSVRQTVDGGFIITGGTYSFGNGNEDLYLIKTDSNGNTEWTKTLGGANDDIGNEVQLTTDSSYVIIGSSSSFGYGEKDFYLVRLNSLGDTLWTKTYGGIHNEEGNSVFQTSDLGFILAGYTNTFSLAGYDDFYLVKTQANGDTLWTKIQGSPDNKRATSIVASYDAGFTFTGLTTGGGNDDALFWQTDSAGTWRTSGSAGGLSSDMGYSIQQTSDHGFIIVGYTNSFAAHPPYVFLVKTDSTGSHPNVISVNEQHASKEILVYPNPFSKSFTIKFNNSNTSDGIFYLYDVLGNNVRTVQVKNYSYVLQVQRESLERGIYFYKLNFKGEEAIIGKIIVE